MCVSLLLAGTAPNEYEFDVVMADIVFRTLLFQVHTRSHVRRAMRLSNHGGRESTEGPSVSSHADGENLGLDRQGFSVLFGVAGGVRHMRRSHHSREQ